MSGRERWDKHSNTTSYLKPHASPKFENRIWSRSNEMDVMYTDFRPCKSGERIRWECGFKAPDYVVTPKRN